MTENNLHHLVREEVHFGFGLPPEINAHLQEAAARISTREQSLASLNVARKAAPDQLEVLLALYKFHFYQGDIEKARDYVYQGLIKASRQGGFSYDWESLTPESANWQAPRGPARFFLYSLKALAFIRLRENAPSEAQEILDTLARLDPEDQVGAGVIRDLASGMSDDD